MSSVRDKNLISCTFLGEAERPPPPRIAQHKLLLAAEERSEYF